MATSTPVCNESISAILAGLRQLQVGLKKGSLSPGVQEVLTDGGASPGLDVDAIDDLCETINCGGLLHRPEHPDVPRIDPELEAPVVHAEMHLSGFNAKASFAANRALAVADDDQLVELGVEDFFGCEASDRIAETEARWNHEIARLFDLLYLLGDVGVETFGFECRISQGEAMAWLKRHRPSVWARILCEINGVRLVQAQEPEVAGRWDWIRDECGDASEASFETRAEAALDAVERLGLTDPREP